MAHKIVKTALKRGSKGTLLHVYLESDGESGELEDFELIDQAGDPDFPELNVFEPARAASDKMRLWQVWYSSSWFDVELKFDALDKTTPWILTRDGPGHYCFEHFGGIVDFSDKERFGKLLLSTSGFGEAGARATLILDLRL